MMGLAYGLLFIALIIECAIFCCKSVARTSPMNYICLFAFTFCETFILSVICSQYPSETVLSAAGMTAVVTVALTFYACTTKTDFTICAISSDFKLIFQILALHPDLPGGHPLQQRQQPPRLQKPPKQEAWARRQLQVSDFNPLGVHIKFNTIINAPTA